MLPSQLQVMPMQLNMPSKEPCAMRRLRARLVILRVSIGTPALVVITSSASTS